VLAVLIVLVTTAQWRPEERVLVSDFSYVDAVAASPWLVFAATRHGLLIYDRVARVWKPPVTTLDGYPTARVRSAVADETGNAVWLGSGGVDGYVRYDVDARMWTRGGAPPAGQTLTVETALARAPAADAIRALILTDPRLRSYQFTAAASTPDRPDLYFGTNGMGLVRVDAQTGEWEALPYGLIATGVGAIAPAEGGIWTATSAHHGIAERRGLTWVAADLSATRPSEGGGAALGFTFFQAWRMISARGALWVATEEGVWRIDPTTFRARRFDVYPVMSLALAPDGVWAGTTKGLFVITDHGRVEPVGAPNLVAFRVLAAGDTLWVGTLNGLRRLLPGASDVAELADLANLPSLRTIILALARVRDTLVLATERELAWRATRSDSVTWSRLTLPPALGLPLVLAPDPDGGVWLGGTQGLAHVDFANPHIRVLSVPLSVPAGARDILTDDKYLWVATDSGLVRFDRRAALNR
jgi:ligand-binding sensor domain-containing protein